MDVARNVSVAKRSVVLSGHKTSVSLEEGFWTSLKEIAASRDMSVFALVNEIDSSGDHPNLSSALRVFVLNHFRRQLGLPAEGWQRVQALTAAE
jgi:predicted DNA-binding ribbon-helix-helix protein